MTNREFPPERKARSGDGILAMAIGGDLGNNYSKVFARFDESKNMVDIR